MEETQEEQHSEGLDFQRYIQIVKRRHIHFLIPFFLGWILVWGVSWLLPAHYKSSTLILVEQPTMPKNYVESNVTDDLQNRLQSITQQILSRTRLLLIIDKLNLYGGGQRKLTPDEKVELMRKDVDIVLVRDARDNQITAFKISYSAREAHVAQQVTSELTSLFINDNLKVRQQQSEDTTKFIESQLENAHATLADQEAKVREFKGSHVGELPSQEASNLQILSGLQAQLQNEQDTLNSAKQQRVYLQTLIEQYRNLHSNSVSDESMPTGDQDIERLRSKLADLRSRYTDSYPEVESLKDELSRAEKARDVNDAELNPQSVATKRPNASGGSLKSPPSQLQGQLQANQVEVTNREQAISDLKARVNLYQNRLNSEPASEEQLADLTRGYEQSKANYDDLLKKQNESEMATSMEHMQQGERFSILDPPSLPLKPDFPNRLKFCAFGLGLGLALGLIVAGGFEYLDDRLYSEKELKTLLHMPILAEIPAIVSPLDEGLSKKKLFWGWAMAVLVVATILVGSTVSYLHG